MGKGRHQIVAVAADPSRRNRTDATFSIAIVLAQGRTDCQAEHDDADARR
jgi:hypothetical protein